jgi:hypothetical protein
VVASVNLEVDKRARVDIQLELGAIEQQVQVAAAISIIETDTASQGTVIDNRRIVELPLNGRNFEQLAVLAPGVIAPVAGAGSDAYFSVAGTRGLSNSFMMDGATNDGCGEILIGDAERENTRCPVLRRRGSAR